MGTHPIFESDFDCLTDGYTYTYIKKNIFKLQQSAPDNPERRDKDPKNTTKNDEIGTRTKWAVAHQYPVARVART